jgi:threonine/homoserine/homoserine lactone efflux protein
MSEVVAHIVNVLPQFAAACLVVAVLPGPATVLFVHRSVRDGRAAGLAAVAGTQIGVFMWALAAGAGLTTLLTANRILFEGLRLAGAVLLVYLGVSAWRNARRPAISPADDIGRRGPGSAWAAFRASLTSIAANPKAAVFAFTFFPQFLPANGSLFDATILLALIQVLIDGAYCVLLVVLAVRVRSWLTRPAVQRRLERVLGTVLIALGVQLAAQPQ